MELNNIRVVLVNTSHPGNIGGVARAMMNMCLKHLYLVSPHRFPSEKARARASGAVGVLNNAVVVDSLAEAVADCGLVFGASARERSIDWPSVEPRQCAAQVAEASPGTPVALVFGNETAGLSNAELAHCNYLVHIPANPDYSSLNLAAAVQVVAYEMYLAWREAADSAAVPHTGTTASMAPEKGWASMADLEGFYTHLTETLTALEFYDPDNPRQLMHRLRRLFNRARLDRMEVNILRGILTAAQKAAASRNQASPARRGGQGADTV